MAGEEPLATHKEQNLERTGMYRLYWDRLELSLQLFLRGSVEMAVPLKNLSGQVARVKVHSSIFNLGLWVLIVPTTALAIISMGGWRNHLSNGVLTLLYSCLIFGLGITAASARKLRFVSLLGREGMPTVVVGEGASGERGLHEFIDAVLIALKSGPGAAA